MIVLSISDTGFLGATMSLSTHREKADFKKLLRVQRARAIRISKQRKPLGFPSNTARRVSDAISVALNCSNPFSSQQRRVHLEIIPRAKTICIRNNAKRLVPYQYRKQSKPALPGDKAGSLTLPDAEVCLDHVDTDATEVSWLHYRRIGPAKEFDFNTAAICSISLPPCAHYCLWSTTGWPVASLPNHLPQNAPPLEPVAHTAVKQLRHSRSKLAKILVFRKSTKLQTVEIQRPGGCADNRNEYDYYKDSHEYDRNDDGEWQTGLEEGSEPGQVAASSEKCTTGDSLEADDSNDGAYNPTGWRTARTSPCSTVSSTPSSQASYRTASEDTQTTIFAEDFHANKEEQGGKMLSVFAPPRSFLYPPACDDVFTDTPATTLPQATHSLEGWSSPTDEEPRRSRSLPITANEPFLPHTPLAPGRAFFDRIYQMQKGSIFWGDLLEDDSQTGLPWTFSHAFALRSLLQPVAMYIDEHRKRFEAVEPPSPAPSPYPQPQHGVYHRNSIDHEAASFQRQTRPRRMLAPDSDNQNDEDQAKPRPLHRSDPFKRHSKFASHKWDCAAPPEDHDLVQDSATHPRTPSTGKYPQAWFRTEGRATAICPETPQSQIIGSWHF